MRYGWRDYTCGDAACVDRWMDDEARYYTGCDDGWDAYISYMLQEDYIIPGENFRCMVISDAEEPIAVAALYLTEDNILCISEFVVSPGVRGMGHGTAMLCELMTHTCAILGWNISKAQAVIFPNNTASIRAFERAGFHFTHAHPDGDAFYYEYDIHKNDVG